MATSTTTLSAIRDQQEATIRALTPSSLASVKFRMSRGERFFEDWAIEHPEASLRVYQIRDAGDYESPPVSDEEIEIWTVTQELVMAYPQNYGLYGTQQIRDLDDVIEKDQHQLDGAIGIRGADNYKAGQHVTSLLSATREEEDGVTFLVMDLETTYYRSVS